MIKETENESDYIGKFNITTTQHIHIFFLQSTSGYQHFVSNQYCGMIRVQRDLLYFAHWTYVVSMWLFLCPLSLD